MSRERSTNRSSALKLWLKSGRTKKLTDIADQLDVSAALVRKWKHLDNWDDIPTKRPRGAPKGNKNAVGNSGGAPAGNENAVKHGLFRKFMPQDPEFLEIMDLAQQMDPLDIIWHTVEIAYTKLIRAQRIMFVRDQDDITREIKKEKQSDSSDETEWEIQFAWDKHAADIKTHSIIMKELRSAIRQFLAAAPENDERRLKLESMNLQIEKTKLQIDVLNKKSGDKKARKLENFL